MREIRYSLPSSEFPPGEELDPQRSRKTYISLDGSGKPYWDLAKIYPDPEKQAQFGEDMESLDDFHALALRYPRWAALTSTPADVAYLGLGGHPSCV